MIPGCDIPSAHVECGFISPREQRKVRDVIVSRTGKAFLYRRKEAKRILLKHHVRGGAARGTRRAHRVARATAAPAHGAASAGGRPHTTATYLDDWTFLLHIFPFEKKTKVSALLRIRHNKSCQLKKIRLLVDGRVRLSSVTKSRYNYGKSGYLEQGKVENRVNK
ncbi:hypothetical protein EVAR_42456_1 [Eumeta japonica]|uniref:Uncharacterized protein n=1 Tax=Eumeta variegata TaxID=151549 RepID=A0A4C1Y284_EUMVA|nr:hypothetical protein EVAR_42456_1 [Eumeta japonica]